MTTPTSDCRDLEVLLSLRASGPGALAPDEAARVDAHLQTCAACRAEADATAAALAAARLPPPAEAEQVRALRDLSGSVRDALRRRDRRRAGVRRVLAGAAVAAAVAACLLAPALLRKAPSVPPTAVAAAEPVWEEPDLDRLWEDTAVLDWDSNAALAGGWDTETATVAALEY